MSARAEKSSFLCVYVIGANTKQTFLICICDECTHFRTWWMHTQSKRHVRLFLIRAHKKQGEFLWKYSPHIWHHFNRFKADAKSSSENRNPRAIDSTSSSLILPSRGYLQTISDVPLSYASISLSHLKILLVTFMSAWFLSFISFQKQFSRSCASRYLNVCRFVSVDKSKFIRERNQIKWCCLWSSDRLWQMNEEDCYFLDKGECLCDQDE